MLLQEEQSAQLRAAVWGDIHLPGGERVGAGVNPLREMIEEDMREMAWEEGGQLWEAWEGTREAETVWTPEWLREFSKLDVGMLWELREDRMKEQAEHAEKEEACGEGATGQEEDPLQESGRDMSAGGNVGGGDAGGGEGWVRGQLKCKLCDYRGSKQQRRLHMMSKHGWLGEVSSLAFENKCVICGMRMCGIRSVQNHYQSYVKTGSCKGIGHNRPIEPPLKVVKEWKCAPCQVWVPGGERGRLHVRRHLEHLRSKAWQRGNERELGLREAFFH